MVLKPQTIVRIGEIPSIKHPGKGLACRVLCENINSKTILFAPRDSGAIAIHNTLATTHRIPRIAAATKNKTTSLVGEIARALKTLYVNLYILRIIYRLEFSLVHIHHPYYLPIAWYAWLVKRRPSVMTCHGYDLIRILHNNLFKWLAAPLKAIVIMDASMMTECMRVFPGKKINFNSNGFDRNLFNSSKPINARSKTISCVGNLNWKKNYPNIIDGFAEIAPLYPDWSLNIYGIGPDLDKLISQVLRLGLDKQIKLHRSVSQDELASALSDTSVFLLASFTEGLPKAQLEAMASGCLCIVSDVGECKNALDGNGFIFRSLDKNGIRDDLKYVLEILPHCQSLATASRKRALDFSWEKYVQKHIDLYASL